MSDASIVFSHSSVPMTYRSNVSRGIQSLRLSGNGLACRFQVPVHTVSTLSFAPGIGSTKAGDWFRRVLGWKRSGIEAVEEMKCFSTAERREGWLGPEVEEREASGAGEEAGEEEEADASSAIDCSAAGAVDASSFCGAAGL